MVPKILFVSASIFLTGCVATPEPTSVQQVGENQYTVSVSMSGIKFDNEENSSLTRGKALDVANAYCSGKGAQYAKLLKENISQGPVATSIIYFSCHQ